MAHADLDDAMGCHSVSAGMISNGLRSSGHWRRHRSSRLILTTQSRLGYVFMSALAVTFAGGGVALCVMQARLFVNDVFQGEIMSDSACICAVFSGHRWSCE